MIADLIGIPYLNQGRDKSVGLDCWGLLRVFYREHLGVYLPSFQDVYQDALDNVAVAAAMDAHQGTWVSVKRPVYGDAVRLRLRGDACHVGVYLGHGQMLHTQVGHDSALDRLDDPRWRHRIAGYYRHRDLMPHHLSLGSPS